MGFFVVFTLNKETKKFELVDRWLNKKSDKGWIERTFIAMGLNPAHVVVAWYWAPMNAVFGGLDDDFKLSSFKKEMISTPDGEVESFVIDETFDPIFWYKNGELLKQYEE